MAKHLGYRGKDAWKENKARIMHVLGPFFEEGENVQMLKRRVAFTDATRL